MLYWIVSLILSTWIFMAIVLFKTNIIEKD